MLYEERIKKEIEKERKNKLAAEENGIGIRRNHVRPICTMSPAILIPLISIISSHLPFTSNIFN